MYSSTRRRSLAFCLVSLGLLTILAVPSLGQSTGGRIVGRVADPTEAVLAGVKVTLVNQATALDA